MSFLLTQLFTFLLLGGSIIFYLTVVKKYFEDKIGIDPLAQFFAKNNGRGTLLFIVALVLSLEMIIVYSNYGFPRSPLVIRSQEIIANHHGILENGAAIFDRLLGEKYFQDLIPKTPTVIDYGSSWWWLLASIVAWFIALAYLPIAFLGGVRNFFRRPKFSTSSGRVQDCEVRIIPKTSESSSGLIGCLYYIFDEFIVKGFTAFGKKIFGGK